MNFDVSVAVIRYEKVKIIESGDITFGGTEDPDIISSATCEELKALNPLMISCCTITVVTPTRRLMDTKSRMLQDVSEAPSAMPTEGGGAAPTPVPPAPAPPAPGSITCNGGLSTTGWFVPSPGNNSRIYFWSFRTNR